MFRRGGRPYAGKHYRKRQGESLVLPAPQYVPEDAFEDIPYPCSIQETCRWIVERPLQTMQRAVHLAFPDTTRWWLDEAPSEIRPPAEDPNLWRTYLWRFHPDEHHPTWWRDVPFSDSGVETEPAPHESIVFAVQPHWILGPQDLSDVADCKSVCCASAVPDVSQLAFPQYSFQLFLTTGRPQRYLSRAMSAYGPGYTIRARATIAPHSLSQIITAGCLARSERIGRLHRLAR